MFTCTLSVCVPKHSARVYLNTMSAYLSTRYEFMFTETLPVHAYLNTIGEGTQNLTRVFLMFSCSVASSKHQDVCSLADGPAVGSEKYKFTLIT